MLLSVHVERERESGESPPVRNIVQFSACDE